jgi:hypothetical protein
MGFKRECGGQKMTFKEMNEKYNYRYVETCLNCANSDADLRCGKLPERPPVGASCRCDSWEGTK